MTALADVTEKDLQAQIVQLAVMLGWRKVYHVYDSRRSHSGWPDLALVKDRLILAELKNEKRPVTPEQKEWIRALLAADVEAYVVRPRDFDDFAVVLGSPSGSRFAGSRARLVERTIAEVA